MLQDVFGIKLKRD